MVEVGVGFRSRTLCVMKFWCEIVSIQFISWFLMITNFFGHILLFKYQEWEDSTLAFYHDGVQLKR